MSAPMTRAQRAAAASLPGLPSERRDRAAAWKLAVPALGIVYGDIGTSPLYAMKECFTGDHHVAPSAVNVLGILSLIVWTLTAVVAVKYLTFILRADNRGEGGILALLALVPGRQRAKRAGPGLLVLLVLFGAALLYGDGVITPAISVLSAVEGLGVATKALEPAIVPLTLTTLVALFLVQKRGTERVGSIFGPVMLVWFLFIGALGAAEVARSPGILRAIDPRFAVRFFAHNGHQGFFVLGGVVLVITGAEALYADMGHFGPGPIRRSWTVLVFPALLLNYFGQGAALLGHEELASNPFYAIVPRWALYPSVVVSTAATIVASQALISGAYSLTQQAVQLGFFPRVTIVHTSKQNEGQIYVPEINWLLAVACVGLVLGFKSSSALGAAYGIAVTGTMAITTLTYAVVARGRWRWPLWRVVPLAGAFLAIDLAYFAACSAKIADGGWFPLLLGALIYTVMTTWNTGRRYLGERMAEAMFPLDAFLTELGQRHPPRVRGTAVFMAANPNGVPPVLLHHFKHNQCLHEQVVLLRVLALHVPAAAPDERVIAEVLEQGFFRVTLSFGFMEDPDVPDALRECTRYGLKLEPNSTSYFLGRETLLTTGTSRMMRWRKALFAFISRNAVPATAYFGLPPGRVVELGMQIDL
ncbi:MAG TPA: potassium transporter Kup [Polyangiaceae bacterium]